MRRALFATLLAVVLALSHASGASAGSTGAAIQPTIDDAVRTVQLERVQNARDLGGLRGSRGFIPHGRFFRAATLVNATPGDRTVLLSRGVTLDIDLRSYLETTQHGDALAHDRRFGYHRISLLGVGIRDWFRANDLHSLYLHTLEDHQSSLRDVFHAIATHENGAVLYHCTSGKDRTGMVTAILLDLAGVPRATIVRDYAISATYLGRAADSSPPEAIGSFLDALDARYGGARAFLAKIGLPQAEIQMLLVKLGQG